MTPPAKRRYQRPGHWDQAAIDRALEEFLAGRRDYPIVREWVAAGLGGLYQTIDERHGGHDPVAKRYGLTRPRSRPRAFTAPSECQ